MQPKFAAFLAVTDVDLTWSMGMDLGFRKERANTKYRPCSSLAFGAITNMDQDRFAVYLCPRSIPMDQVRFTSVTARKAANFGCIFVRHAGPPYMAKQTHIPV